MADETLEVLFIGKDQVSGVVSDISGNIQNNLQNAALGVAGLVAGAAGLGVASVSMAADFDAAMRNVNAIIQLPEQEFANLRDQVLDFSLTTRASSTDVANALYNVVSAGFQADEAFAVMTASSRAAGAGLADTETTSRLLISALRAYKLPVEDAENVTDIFLQTVNSGITTLPELASALGRIMPIASNLGVGLDELGFTIGGMTQSGLSTDEAVTRLMATFTQLLNPTAELQDAIEELGYTSGYDLVQQSGGALGALRLLKDEGFIDNTEEAANLFSNVRALGGVLSITNSESLMAADGIAQFGDAAAGAVERAREQQYMSFSANLAKLKSAFEAIAIKVGTALLPALISLLDYVVPIAREFGSNLTPVLEIIEEVAGRVSEAFQFLFTVIQESGIEGLFTVFEDGSTRLDAFLQKLGLGEDAARSIALAVIDLKERVQEFLAPIVEWITNFVTLKDVVIAVAIAIGVALLPVIVSIVTTLLPVIATLGAVVLAVAFVRNVWENDFLGIRTALENFWYNTGEPIFNTVKEWLEINIPIAIEILKGFWENTLLPAIQAVWGWISGTLIPFFANTVFPWLAEKIPQALQLLSDFWTGILKPAIEAVWGWISGTLIPFLADTVYPWLQEKIPEALQTLSDFWSDVLQPALTAVWEFIRDSVIPILEAVWDVIDAYLNKVLEALAGLWENVLLPALEAVWEFLQDSVIPILKDLWAFIQDTLGPVIEWIRDRFGEVSDAVGGISGVVEGVIGWLTDLADTIRGIQLPDWLTPGSPTPFEEGLWGINAALTEVNRSMADFGRASTGLVISGDFRNRGTTNQNFYLTANYKNVEREDLIADVRLLGQMAG